MAARDEWRRQALTRSGIRRGLGQTEHEFPAPARRRQPQRAASRPRVRWDPSPGFRLVLALVACLALLLLSGCAAVGLPLPAEPVGDWQRAQTTAEACRAYEAAHGALCGPVAADSDEPQP